MIKGVTRAGVGQAGSVQQFARLAAAHGFGAIDASGKELAEWIQSEGKENVLETLQALNVQIGSIGLSADWRKDEEAFRSGLPQFVRDAEAAAALGVTRCCTYVLPSTDQPAAQFTVAATRRLRTAAEVLDAYGIRLGLEFVGPHHLRTRWANPFIWDIPGTLEWIDAIGKRNVGLLFDAFHWYTSEASYDDILKLKAEQIVHVHINDAPNVPVSEVIDNERVYPGEGVIPLADFLRGLTAIGYDGVVAQEILRPQPPEEPTEALFAKSQQAFATVFAAAGLK